MANKLLNYEELWNSFRAHERKTIIKCADEGHNRIGADAEKSLWQSLSSQTRQVLLACDWEVSLGKRF